MADKDVFQMKARIAKAYKLIDAIVHAPEYKWYHVPATSTVFDLDAALQRDTLDCLVGDLADMIKFMNQADSIPNVIGQFNLKAAVNAVISRMDREPSLATVVLAHELVSIRLAGMEVVTDEIDEEATEGCEPVANTFADTNVFDAAAYAIRTMVTEAFTALALDPEATSLAVSFIEVDGHPTVLVSRPA